MNKYIEQSIEARKNAFSLGFEINAEMQKKIDILFAEIEELGEKCKDVGEFEAEFAKSSLNQEYMDLFTETATRLASKQAVSQVAKSMVGGAIEGVARNMLSNVVPTRASVNQTACDAERKVPGLGDAIDFSQKASYVAHLGKMFGGGRRKRKEQDNEKK